MLARLSRTVSPDRPGFQVVPTCSARCWTSVVFPVPVSPTSSTGSCCDAATATASRERMTCPVAAKALPCDATAMRNQTAVTQDLS